MKLSVKKGTLDVTIHIVIQDSSVTTGAGKTGLVFNSAGLVCWYVRPLANPVQVTLATQTVTGAHSDGGFVELGSASVPGKYRLDLPDAVCATGVPFVTLMLHGATNMAPVPMEILLTDNTTKDVFDLLEATLWIDIAVTPWALVHIKKGTGALGTGTELLRQTLKDTAGVNITTTTQVIGQIQA